MKLQTKYNHDEPISIMNKLEAFWERFDTRNATTICKATRIHPVQLFEACEFVREKQKASQLLAEAIRQLPTDDERRRTLIYLKQQTNLSPQERLLLRVIWKSVPNGVSLVTADILEYTKSVIREIWRPEPAKPEPKSEVIIFYKFESSLALITDEGVRLFAIENPELLIPSQSLITDPGVGDKMKEICEKVYYTLKEIKNVKGVEVWKVIPCERAQIRKSDERPKPPEENTNEILFLSLDKEHKWIGETEEEVHATAIDPDFAYKNNVPDRTPRKIKTDKITSFDLPITTEKKKADGTVELVEKMVRVYRR